MLGMYLNTTYQNKSEINKYILYWGCKFQTMEEAVLTSIEIWQNFIGIAVRTMPKTISDL